MGRVQFGGRREAAVKHRNPYIFTIFTPIHHSANEYELLEAISRAELTVEAAFFD